MREIRFAVGSEAEPASTVWKLWAKGNDVYVTARPMGHFMKASLHESCSWSISFTKESGVIFEYLVGGRHQVLWKRPPQFRPGWTEGLTILFPHPFVKRPFKAPQHPKPRSNVHWTPIPPPGQKVDFTVVFADGDRSADEFVTAAQLIPSPIHLPNGEQVWLSARTCPMLEDEERSLAHSHSLLKIHPTRPEFREFVATLFTFCDGPRGSQIIVEFALGEENIGEARPRAAD